MKKETLLTLLIAIILSICPMTVLAADELADDQGAPAAADVLNDADTETASDVQTEPAEAIGDYESASDVPAYAATPGGWNDPVARTQYLDPDGKPLKSRLFIAAKKSGKLGLYYADSKGYVLGSSMSPFSGKVTPTNGPFYYLGSNGAWVAATSSRSYYLNDTDEDYYMADVKGIYGGNTKYYVNANAYIKSSAGIVTDTDGSKYYVKDGGTVKTTAGFVKYNKKTYYVAKTGKIRTAKGKFEANDGKYHLITSSTGSLRVNEGFVTYNNKRYYVTGSNNGALARSKVVTVKEKGKTKHYHMNSSCTTMNGLHTWKGNKYVASHYGVLYSYGVHKLDGKYYFSVNDYGKLKIHDFFTYKGNSYFASAKDGHLLTGVINWYDGKYYYCDDKCRMVTSAQLFKYGGKYYFNNKGGGLRTNKMLTYNNKHYYAGSNAAILTSPFRYANVYVTPNSATGEISFKDWNAINGYKWKYYQYIQVNISSQTLRYYVNGETIVSCNIVSGTQGKYDTIKGTYTIKEKRNNMTSKMGEQDIRFDYWMRFGDTNKQAVGDGPYWLATYGGNIYKSNGSNGEILLPYSPAKTLFNNTPSGTVIVIQ